MLNFSCTYFLEISIIYVIPKISILYGWKKCENPISISNNSFNEEKTDFYSI